MIDLALLECIPDAVLLVAADAGVRHANTAAERLFGWSRTELAGRPLAVLIPQHGALPDWAPPGERDRAPAPSLPLRLELRGRKRSGEELSIELNLAALGGDDEILTLATVRDVTGRREIERRAALYRSAQEELRKRDEFLSIASHELRTPVTALQLQLELLGRALREGGRLPPPAAARLEVAERQVRRVGVLVNELLDFSRLRLGGIELDRADVDLARIAEEAVARLAPESARAGCAVALQAEPATGLWDARRVRQLIAILLGNAVKFGRGKPVEVEVRAGRGEALLAVRDAGLGIEPADQGRVFEPFQRAVSPREYGGFGLGLYVARVIVEAHGGCIALESERGSGTTVTVVLPRSPERPAGGDRAVSCGPGAHGEPR